MNADENPNQPRKHTESHGQQDTESLILNPVFLPHINTDKIKNRATKDKNQEQNAAREPRGVFFSGNVRA
jgi:hypothetical protein